MSATAAVKTNAAFTTSAAERDVTLVSSNRRLRIAQIAPLSESVPPKLYGGTERVVANLCDELIHQGHEVTLFASGDSKTLATLVPACPQALRLSASPDPLAIHLHMIETVAKRAEDFDVGPSDQSGTGVAPAVVPATEPNAHRAHRRART